MAASDAEDSVQVTFTLAFTTFWWGNSIQRLLTPEKITLERQISVESSQSPKTQEAPEIWECWKVTASHDHNPNNPKCDSSCMVQYRYLDFSYLQSYWSENLRERILSLGPNSSLHDQHARRGVSPMRARTAFGDVWEGFLAGSSDGTKQVLWVFYVFVPNFLRELCHCVKFSSHSAIRQARWIRRRLSFAAPTARRSHAAPRLKETAVIWGSAPSDRKHQEVYPSTLSGINIT